MTVEIFLLRIVHIVGGTFWVGSALFTSLFLAPALATSGANAGQVFAALAKRRLSTVLPVVGILTILSGLRLMWIASGGFSTSYFASPSGGTFAGSGAATMVAFLLGILVTRPSAVRAGRIGSTMATAPMERRAGLEAELAMLRRRSALASGTAAALMVLGAAGMAVARYVG
jgi:uncharacterized membrane protein